MHPSEYLPIAKKVARNRVQSWHDVDGIEGEILYELVRKKPEKPLHAWRIAWNTKVDCIRKEYGVTGKKKNIRYTFPLLEASNLTYEFESDIENRDLIKAIMSCAEEDDQKIISMLYQGYSQAAIAKEIGISSTALNGRIEKLRKRTLQFIGEQ